MTKMTIKNALTKIGVTDKEKHIDICKALK